MSKSIMRAAVISIDSVYADFERNFRDPAKDYADCYPTEGFDREKYEAGNMAAGFFEDILLNGVQTPIAVVLLTLAQRAEVLHRTGKEYLYRLAKGHRRFFTVGLINERFPNTITDGPALVYEGLTAMEEWELLSDHSPTRREAELSGAGVYRAVIKLHAAGFSQEKIGNMMGKGGKGYAQRHVNVHLMRNATPVETHWLGIHLAKDDADRPVPCYKLTTKHIDDLTPAFNADKVAGRDPMAIGSEFRREWDKVAATGKTTNDSAPKSHKREDILSRKTFTDGRPALAEVLDFAANNGGSMEVAGQMYDKLAEKASKADSLLFEVDRLQGEVAGLTSQLQVVTDERDTINSVLTTVRADRDAIGAELDAVKDERDAVRAELDAVKASRDADLDTVKAELDAYKSGRVTAKVNKKG